MASVFSSLFGVGQQPQQQPQAAAITTQQLPKEVAPYYEKLLKEAEALYKKRMEEGAPKYIDPVTGERGKTIAGFTPEQEQMFTGIKALEGTTAPKFAEAETLTRGTAAKITPEEVQEYMNPYQQAVTDIEKREAEKKYQTQVLQPLRAQAAATQPYGGSRQAIQEGMASEAQQRLLADIQAKGSAQAYQDAMTNISAQRQRAGLAAGQLAQMAPAAYGARARELGAVGQIGDIKRQQTQLALDEAYKEFLQEQQFPGEALKQYQATVQSFPNIPTAITRTPPPTQPSLATQLTGLGATALGTYGAFGGFEPGGLFGKKASTGGGIANLPIVYRQQGGKTNLPGTIFSRWLAGTYKDIRDKAAEESAAARAREEASGGGLMGGSYEDFTRRQDAEEEERGANNRNDIKLSAIGEKLNVREGIESLYDNTIPYSSQIKADEKQADNKWLYSERNPSVLSDHQRVSYGPEGAYVITKHDPETGEDIGTVSSVPPPRELFDDKAQGANAQDDLDKAITKGEEAGKEATKSRRDILDKLPTLTQYKHSPALQTGLTSLRKGYQEDVAAAEADVEESKALSKRELWSTLIGLGANITSGAKTIPQALTLLAKDAVDVNVKGKKRTKELKKAKRGLERELQKYDIDLAKWTDDKVSKRDQDIFNRMIQKEQLGLDLDKHELAIKQQYISAYSAVSERKRAEAAQYAAENPTSKETYSMPSAGHLKSLDEFATGYVANIRDYGSENKKMAEILKQATGKDFEPKDVYSTIYNITNDPAFNTLYSTYHKANVDDKERTGPVSPLDTLRTFLPAYLKENPHHFSTEGKWGLGSWR